MLRRGGVFCRSRRTLLHTLFFIKEIMPDYKNTAATLEAARDKGLIKTSSCANACSWLAPSFAAVEIDGRLVGDHIAGLAAQQRWTEIDNAFFEINGFGTAGVRGKLAIGTAYFNKIILGLGVEALKLACLWREGKPPVWLRAGGCGRNFPVRSRRQNLPSRFSIPPSGRGFVWIPALRSGHRRWRWR